MNLDVVRQLHRVKTLHADRAEEEQRRCKAVLAAAVAAVDQARATLQSWRDEMPARQAAIYDAIIGQLVDLEELDAVKARVAALRDHERLLETRLTEAETAAKAAVQAMEAATRRVDQARRDVTKFEDLVDVLRRAALAEAERKEDSELEESAESRRDRDDAAEEGEGRDEWDFAA